ncbi:cysteine desulfurase family protein [Streptococcus iniae]|uniref:cysteine desulfurase family protein n=1 Tax=Streptococcus iniae TaxID=1346 RepID=UPI002B2A443C|nr:cysteine desulfurase family protein [Streptococcus iniae]WNZ90718.1 cysteine desulfurase family protein [Streptococcus iniae]WNZ92346.1 cysteine desulfurase family protein [Streptococcus iniae]
MIYFDNVATTPLLPSVIEAMTESMQGQFGNPSSIHSYGRAANKTLRDCRQSIAQLLGVESRNIIFTSGGTESNNTAIKGYALANQSKGKHLITTSIEHHSVLHTMAYLEERFGFEVTYIKPQNRHITAQQIKDALREDTILVSVMAANNETGDLLPISEIGQALKDHQAVFHVDAVQTMGKIEISPITAKIDLLSASAHKFHGPKGVGFLYANPLHFDSLLHGGDQEEKRRASTENMIGIVGMTKALEVAYEMKSQHWQTVTNLKESFLNHLSGIDFYLTKNEESLPHILNIGFPNCDNATLLTRLDLEGFAISTGSACTAGNVQPSHVLENYYGKTAPALKESIRVSFSELNHLDDVQLLTKHLKTIIGG